MITNSIYRGQCFKCGATGANASHTCNLDSYSGPSVEDMRMDLEQIQIDLKNVTERLNDVCYTLDLLKAEVTGPNFESARHKAQELNDALDRVQYNSGKEVEIREMQEFTVTKTTITQSLTRKAG